MRVPYRRCDMFQYYHVYVHAQHVFVPTSRNRLLCELVDNQEEPTLEPGCLSNTSTTIRSARRAKFSHEPGRANARVGTPLPIHPLNVQITSCPSLSPLRRSVIDRTIRQRLTSYAFHPTSRHATMSMNIRPIKVSSYYARLAVSCD